jgi:hypothetical protein
MATTPPEQAPDVRARGAQSRVQVIGMRSRGVVSQPEDRHRSRDGGIPFLLEHDILKVDNVDNVEWDFKWERKRYRVKPGETALVPFPALVNALGDPRSVANEQLKFRTENGQGGIIPTRYESIVTLFARYGVTDMDLADLIDFAPKVIVRHMETDQEIKFPAQDPECPSWPVPQHAAPGMEPSGDKAAILAVQEENAGLRGEIAELRQLVNERLSGQPAPVGVPDVGGQGGFAEALAGDPRQGGAIPDRGPASTFE